MLLGFKRRFAPFVEDGSKTHTIRGRRKRRLKPGEICHCYVDPRQKSMRLLGRWRCARVEDIRISLLGGDKNTAPFVSIKINGQFLSDDEARELAWRDGFRPARRCDALVSFGLYWMNNLTAEQKKQHRQHHLVVFEGDLIHWEYTKAWAKAPKPARRKVV